MDAPAESPEGRSDEASEPVSPRDLRDLAEKLLLAGLGFFAETRDRAGDLVSPAAGGHRLTARAAALLSALADDLGFVRHDRYEELELRVAQLEHRVRLLEGKTDSDPPNQTAPS